MDPVQDTFNESVSSLLERKVRSWLSGVIEDMRRSSPVQQWIDSLPPEVIVEDENAEQNTNSKTKLDNTIIEIPDIDTIVEKPEDDADINVDNFEDKTLDVPNLKGTVKRNSLDNGILTSTPQKSSKNRLQRDYSVQSEGARKLKHPLLRDGSLQSDASGSSGSSVLNVLGARKVDAESVFIALGFGPSEKQQQLQRIPDRFLVPSKLKGISTEQFIKDEQHSMKMHDCGIFGYRGLTGNPHVPPSSIVAKIIDCLLQGESRQETLMRTRHSIADMRIPPPIRARQRYTSNQK